MTVKDIELFQGDVNAKDDFGWTALFEFAFYDRTDVDLNLISPQLCEALLIKGARIRAVTGLGAIIDALSLAIAGRHVETCLAIINNWPTGDFSVPLTAKFKGKSYLHLSAAQGLVPVVKRLKERGDNEDLLIEDDNHKTPLEFARLHCTNQAHLAELEAILPERPPVATPAGGVNVAANVGGGASSVASERGGSRAAMPKSSERGGSSAVHNTKKRAREEMGSQEPAAKKEKGKGKATQVPGEGGG